MNYETKRDVFEGVVETLNVMDGAPDDYCKELIDNYDAALPDDVPVIPKEIAKYINDMKSSGRDIWDVTHYLLRSNNIGEYMEDNSEIFARAWVLGVWRVEETGEIVKLEEIDDGD